MSLLDVSESSDLNIQPATEVIDNTIHHQLLVDCLKKEKKNLGDCERIYETVRTYDFFKNFFGPYESEGNTSILLNLCGEMKYETAKMGSFVFNQGDKSNQKFYVILNGQAGMITRKNFNPFSTTIAPSNRPPVYTMNTIKDEQTSADTKDGKNAKSEAVSMNELPKRKSTLRFGENFGNAVARSMAAKRVVLKARQMLKGKSQAHSLTSLDEEGNPDQEFKELAEQYGNLIRVLKSGDDFGETIFKKPGQKRSVSILCKTDCELLVVSADTYNSFVTAIREKKKNFILDTFSFLTSIRSSLLEHRFIYSFFNQRFCEGDKVTEEGQVFPNPKIYLIENGSCKIQKRFNIEIKNPFNPSKVIHTQTHWLTVCVVGPGTLLGEETLLQNESEEKYEYRTIVNSKKLSTLSINKKVFIQLHPDMEQEVIKFYNVKRKQREEVYAKLVQEIISHGGHKGGDTFFKKHTGLTQLLSKKALNTFAGRENRVIINRSLPFLTAQSTGNNLESTADANTSSRKAINYNKTDHNRSHNIKLILEEPEDLSSEKKRVENPSVVLNRDTEASLGKYSGHDRSLSIHREHHHNNGHSLNESGFKNFEEQPIITGDSQRGQVRNILSPSRGDIDDFSNRFQLAAGGRPGDLAKQSNFVQSISNDLQKFHRPKTSQLNPLQRVITPKARTIRMKINSPEECAVIGNPRTSKNEQLRNSYFEKIKLPDTPEDLDLENFRLNFDDKQPKKRKSSESVKNKSQRESIISQMIVFRNDRGSHVGEDASKEFLRLPQQKIFAPLKLAANEELKGSRSVSPSLKFAALTSDSKRKTSDRLERNSNKDSCVSKSSILTNCFRKNKEPIQIIVPSSMELSTPYSIVKVIQGKNDIEVNALSEAQTITSDQQKSKDIMSNGLHTAISHSSSHNLLAKLLLQKSQIHQKLHKKSSNKFRDSIATKDTSKNNSRSSLMIDNR